MKLKRLTHLVLILTVLGYSCACQKNDDIDITNTDIETPDWTDISHSKSAETDYSIVFPQDSVLRFDIVIDPEYWQKLEDDLADNIGSDFFMPGPGGPGGGGPGGGIGGADLDFDPIWIPCSFLFIGIEWYLVGIRAKGNSSLRSSYQSGIGKYSFKLDFDEFEDDIEAIKNQRFYGFKQLNLNNNYDDASLMREKVASDLFRDFGLVSAQTAFVAVYIDHGDGSQFFGLYTLVEEVDNTVIESQLGDDSGNIYKPEGSAATFASGTYDEDEMYKKNNEDIADYQDVYSLYTAINNDLRSNDIESWKKNLEQEFDTEEFLKWLAANTTMQNWDTYGVMNHNYYLYNNHNSGKLQWVPWDNNEALQTGKQGGALSLSLSEAGTGWPLIKYVIDQDEYKQKYIQYLRDFTNEVFTVAQLESTYEKWQNLIAEYAELEESDYSFLNSSSDFYSAVSYLKTHAQQRVNAVTAFIN